MYKDFSKTYNAEWYEDFESADMHFSAHFLIGDIIGKNGKHNLRIELNYWFHRVGGDDFPEITRSFPASRYNDCLNLWTAIKNGEIPKGEAIEAIKAL